MTSPTSWRRASRPIDSAITRIASCGSMKHSGTLTLLGSGTADTARVGLREDVIAPAGRPPRQRSRRGDRAGGASAGRGAEGAAARVAQVLVDHAVGGTRLAVVVGEAGVEALLPGDPTGPLEDVEARDPRRERGQREHVAGRPRLALKAEGKVAGE